MSDQNTRDNRNVKIYRDSVHRANRRGPVAAYTVTDSPRRTQATKATRSAGSDRYAARVAVSSRYGA